MPRLPKMPPVKVWRLISDGIEAPLMGGFMRGIKHIDVPGLDEDSISRIVETQHDYLLNWFSDTFDFGDDN